MAETNCAKWRRESVPAGLRERAVKLDDEIDKLNLIGG
jgi:hypothetical protein